MQYHNCHSPPKTRLRSWIRVTTHHPPSDERDLPKAPVCQKQQAAKAQPCLNPTRSINLRNYLWFFLDRIITCNKAKFISFSHCTVSKQNKQKKKHLCFHILALSSEVMKIFMHFKTIRRPNDQFVQDIARGFLSVCSICLLTAM